MFTIDGITWQYPCQIERTAEMTASEISGLMLDKSYFNDVLGTWMKYSLTLAVPLNKGADYYDIYEKLTEPVEGHSFVFPYNNSNVAITGRVTSVKDVWVRLPDSKNYWRGTQFEIIANYPTKTKQLQEVITRGITPPPNVLTEAPLTIGDVYQYTSSGWDKLDVVDAENMEF